MKSSSAVVGSMRLLVSWPKIWKRRSAALADGGRDEQGLGGGVQFEVFGGMGEGVVGDERGDVGELGLLGLEEFAAGGGVEEEVADGDGGSGGKASLFDAEDVAAGDLDEGAGVVFGGAGFEGEAGDAGDGGEGFAAEAEGGDGEQVVGGAELARWRGARRRAGRRP